MRWLWRAWTAAWSSLTTVLRKLVRPGFPKRHARERFLLPHEWLAIRPILDTYPTKVRVYFTLLFLIGCRRDELRTAHWTQFDLQDRENAMWHKPKGKNGRRQLVSLAPECVDLLNELPRVGPYPFTGETEQQMWSRTAVTYWWRKTRWAAGVPDVRIHDLRRSTGSWMTISGENLKTVQTVLDHSDIQTTQIYARLDVNSTRAAFRRHAKQVCAPQSGFGSREEVSERTAKHVG